MRRVRGLLPFNVADKERGVRKYVVIAVMSLIALAVSCGGGSGGSNADGRIYYVDSASGSDANDGRSETTAWRSLEKVNMSDLQAGDTVLFRKDRAFSGGLELTRSGSSGEPITFGAYGTGANPVFLGLRTETGWSPEGNGIYMKTISCTPGKTGAGIVLQDGTPLAFKEWDTDAATSLGAENGVCTFDPRDLSTSVIYIRCTDGADPATHAIDAGYHLIGVHSTGVSHISIENIAFRNYSLHGVSLRNSHDIRVSGCAAENIGGAALTVSPSIILAGNGFEFTLDSSDCAVTDSSASNIFDSGFSPQVFESGATARNVSFTNCVADVCGFAGIEISVLRYNASSGERIENVTVSGCTVRNSGTGWSGRRYGTEGNGIRVKADDGAGTITGVSITQTEVTGCAGSGIYVGGESGTVDVSRSLIHANAASGILCQDAGSTNATLKLRVTSSVVRDHTGAGAAGVGYTVVNGNGFDISNNTFYGNSISVYVGNCGGAAAIKNNAFLASNTSQTYLYGGADLASVQSDYNCFSENGGNILGWISSAYTAVSAFALDTGLDQHSIGSDPKFVSSPGDFHLQPSSPCKNTGVAAGVAVDYEGAAYGATPSRGAYR